MENTNLPNDNPQATAAPAPQPVSGWRIAVGILVCIFTLLSTAVLLFMSICFGLLLNNSSSSYGSDAPWIYGLFLVTILVPIGGTWLAVRLFRGARPAGVAGLERAAPAPAAVQTVPPQEAEERLAYLRLCILVAILARAALLVLNLAHYRNTAYHVSLVAIVVSFVLYEIPYVIALIGIRSRGERWALSLAFMYPIFALCATAFSLLTIIGPLRAGMATGPNLLLHYGLTAAIDVAILIFAWRAWQAERTSDDAMQLTVWGVASAIYLFVLHFITPLLYRLLRF
jgi:hypothetical protein